MQSSTRFYNQEPRIYINIGDSVHVFIGAIAGLDDLISQLNELRLSVMRLVDALSLLLELLLILVTKTLAGVEMAVSLCNRLYGACVKADARIDSYVEQLLNGCMWFYVGFEQVIKYGQVLPQRG